MPMLLHKTPGLPIKPFINPLVSGAVLILPAAILVAPHLGEAAYLLLAVLGVYYFLSNSLHYRSYQPVLLLSFLTLGFVLIALALVLVSDNPSAGLSKLGNLREFMAAPFIGLLLLNTRVSTRFIMLTVKISAFLVFMTVYYQLLTGVIRPGGAVNPLVFAVPSLLLGFFSLARFPLESTAEKLLSLVAFSSGCMAAVISQSRAAWILSIFLLICILFFWYRTDHLNKRIALGVPALFLAMVVVSLQAPAVKQRINSALNEYQSFSMDSQWESSVGIRIIMWESGLSAALRKPVTGWGADQTQAAAASELATREMKQVVLGYNHLHNEYLNNLVARGIPGLLSLLLLVFVPLAVFLKNSGNPERLVVNSIGSLLCMGYAISGLSNQAFGDDTLNMFFVFFLAITLPDSNDCINHNI